MATLQEAVDDFLAQKRIAVTGVSRKGDIPANAIYRKLRGAGYEVFATNPNTDKIEGDPCYPDLKSIPGGVDGVVIATHPAVSEQVAAECVELGVPRVWIHRSIGDGSLSEKAVTICRENGITVIPAGCPMMFVDPVDFGHKCMKWMFSMTGRIPKEV